MPIFFAFAVLGIILMLAVLWIFAFGAFVSFAAGEYGLAGFLCALAIYTVECTGGFWNNLVELVKEETTWQDDLLQ